MKNNFIPFLILFLIGTSQLTYGQVDWGKISSDFNQNIQKTLNERQNQRNYYENLKNQSLNNIYQINSTNEYNSIKSYAIQQILYSGQQSFVEKINNSYNQLTSGRLKPNTFESDMNSYNSNFRNFTNSIFMISNRINDLVNRGKNLNEIEQSINSVYNSNMYFIIDTYQVQLNMGNNQIISFNNLINNINKFL